MKPKTIRNISYAPNLRSEGVLICPLPSPPPPMSDGEVWYTHLSPHDRLYYHQTLNSVRHYSRFIPTAKIPKDSLDFQLQSRYDHGREIFPEKIDSLLQKESCTRDGETFRVLRNATRIVEVMATPSAMKLTAASRTTAGKKTTAAAKTLKVAAMIPLFPGHPLKIGGITEKISPHSVKLINSGVHSQLVNNGYSRHRRDGNFFRY